MSAENSYQKDQVVSIINSVIDRVRQTEPMGKESVVSELTDILRVIEDFRKDVALSPMEINDKHIPSATDELDAVVKATASATGDIMDSCEAIEAVAAEIDPAQAEKLTAEVVKVYEACSFQDITGQRITKVVVTLRTIEMKISSLLGALGIEAEVSDGEDAGSADASDASDASEATSVDDPESLLNGPQMPDEAISQDEIDKLLAEFD